MIQPGRAAFVAAAGLFVGLAASAQDAPVRPVTVIDELGADQADEVIAVFSDGRLLGTLHVDGAHRTDSFEVVLPDGVFGYALCGRLRKLGPDGSFIVRRIDNAGEVPVRPGDTLRAFTLDDTLFALQAPDTAAKVAPGPACDPAIS